MQFPHLMLPLLTSVENLDETREQKEKSPPDQSAVPNTPPSTPVKLEGGESCVEALWLPCWEGLHGLWALAMECGRHPWTWMTCSIPTNSVLHKGLEPAVSPVPALSRAT